MRPGRICVFAKPPRAGQVKTRLAPLIGEEGAANLALAFLSDTCAPILQLDWARLVLASTEPFPAGTLPDGFDQWPQGEGDLSERLERILTQGLADASFAIALGADSPGLPLSFLHRARVALDTADAVIGPTDDGGFYLLGLKRFPPGLLAGIGWSQSTTCAQTVARLEAAGMRVARLDPWFDVDRPEDLARLRALITSGKVQAPATEGILARLLPAVPEVGSATISVIIPVLDERECLPRCLAELRKRSWPHEIIVVDGGSTDGTREWLARQSGLLVLDSARGKGPQINAGAARATGDVLLLLHADSILPDDAGLQIRKALLAAAVAGGCFRVRLDASRPRSLIFVSAGINLRARLTRSGTGDQAIFVRSCIFQQAGGCPDWPLFEDVELVRRIKRRGKFRVLSAAVTISSRRYLRHGIVGTACRIYVLRLAFRAGVSPFTLKRWFGEIRSQQKKPPRDSRSTATR